MAYFKGSTLQESVRMTAEAADLLGISTKTPALPTTSTKSIRSSAARLSDAVKRREQKDRDYHDGDE